MDRAVRQIRHPDRAIAAHLAMAAAMAGERVCIDALTDENAQALEHDLTRHGFGLQIKRGGRYVEVEGSLLH